MTLSDLLHDLFFLLYWYLLLFNSGLHDLLFAWCPSQVIATYDVVVDVDLYIAGACCRGLGVGGFFLLGGSGVWDHDASVSNDVCDSRCLIEGLYDLLLVLQWSDTH